MKLNKLREEMAQSFIDALKEDRIPWEQGWQSQDRPRNVVSDYSYKGINNLWLSYIAGEKGYRDPRWCTFKQAQSQGWKVRKGEKGSRVEFWSLYDTENKRKVTQEEVKKMQEQLSAAEFQERIKPVSSVYTVFNAEQIDGVLELDKVKIPFSAEELISQRDVLLKNMNVDFHEGGDRAFYRPADDSITLPLAESFQDAYAYMSTFLHEAGHATGHESRLDRPVGNTFGSPAYAKEELRAEIASAFTGQALGIDGMGKEHLDNHKAYIQSWIETLENNPGELYAAIRDAEKISDYLIEKGEFDLDAKMRDLEPGRFEMDDKMMQVSRQLAGRLVNDGIGIHITEHERHYRDDTSHVTNMQEFVHHAGSKSFMEPHLSFRKGKSSYPASGWNSFEVSRLSFETRESFFPTVQCTLMEKPGWDGGLTRMVTRTYTLSEFDAMMKQGLNQNVEFTIQTESQRIKEVLEMGDGSGGLLEYLEKNGYRKEFIKNLQEEMEDHVQVMDKIKYETSNHTVRDTENGMMKVSRPLAEKLAEDGIYVYVKPEDPPGQTHGRRAADLQELQELSEQASGEISLYVSQETLEFLEKYGDGKEFIEDLQKEINTPYMLDQIVKEAVEWHQPSEKQYNTALYSDQEASSIRLAIKGREQDVEVWKNDIGYKAGLAASEYLEQGMDIRDVIMNHLGDIDAQCLVGDLAYTKNILSSVYSHNTEEYRNLNAVLTAGESENLMKVSDQLAGRLIEDGRIDVYVKTIDPAGQEDISRVADLKELSVMDQGSESLYILRTALEESNSLFPTVQCRLSESYAFEEGKIYTVSEFDSRMELEDRLFLEKKLDLLQKYKDFDGVAQAIVEDGLPGNSLGYLGYHKVEFTIQIGNRCIKERQDIGDGDGGLVEFLEKSGYSKETIAGLQEEMNTHTEFLSYQEKLHDIWNNLDYPSGIEERSMHLEEQNNTFRMSAKQRIQGRGSAKGVVPIGR
ncbi:MAG: ssDNA-binding domain-containing protein [Lachnospiraceae bacterium]|nr:ssDNA-binding domain-containing protein [Lachnospiraceae bacterium]